jgi:hypothetical protein
MDAISELITTKDRVKEILRQDNRARNSDLWLVLQVWRLCNKVNFYIPYDKIQDLTAFETISRVRRQIQNKEGLYPPTDKAVLINRGIKQEIYHKYYGKGDFNGI